MEIVYYRFRKSAIPSEGVSSSFPVFHMDPGFSCGADDHISKHAQSYCHPEYQARGASAFEHIVIALQINDHDDHRHAPGHVPLKPGREMKSFAFIGLLLEIHPAPAVLSGAEQHIAKTSQRQ